LIQRRLSGLSTRAREIIEFASVLGRVIDIDLLVAADWHSRGTVVDALEELVSSQILEVQQTAGLRFAHDKVRESVYRGLGLVERIRLHALAAAAIERKSGSDLHLASVCSKLAHHWTQAGEVGKAIPYWARAGKRSLETAAHDDAIRYFESAIRLASSQPAADVFQICQWERFLGEAYFCRGKMQESETHLLRCLDGLGYGIPAASWRRSWSFAKLLGIQLWQRLVSFPISNDERRNEASLAAARLAFIRAWKNDVIATTTAVLTSANLADVFAQPPSARPYAILGLTAGFARLHRLEQSYFRRVLALTCLGHPFLTSIPQALPTV